MSLAQLRTAGEGLNVGHGTDRRGSIGSRAENGSLNGSLQKPKAVWQTVSYDAFAAEETWSKHFADPARLPNKAAYNVSATKRAAQIAFAVFACALSSGIVCGFAALKPVLVAEGVYSNLCAPDERQSLEPCPAQDMRLNLFFISASIMLNVSTVFAGFVLDHYGRRTCYVLSVFILAAGSVLMASAFAIRFDGYTAANLLLGLGGTFIFVPSFQLANAFPKYAGIIVALVTGAFDASAAVFLFYRMAYEASGGSFKPQYFFFGFVVVPVMILLAEFTFMPAQAYQTRPELEERLEKAQDATRDVHDSDDDIAIDAELQRIRSRRAEGRLAKRDRIENIAGNADQRQRREERAEKRQETSGVWGVLHDLPVTRQMATPWFVLILLLTLLQMLRMNYFIATVHAQYRFMLESEQLAERINNFFDIALPVAGVFSTPFIGILLNELSVVVILAILTVFIVVLGVLNCLQYLWAGYASVVAFVFFRPLYYSAMSDYTTKVFGFATFGRIFGTVTTVSGLFNFIQPGLDSLTHGPLHGNPIPINVAFALAGVTVSTILTGYVYFKGKAYRANHHAEAEGGESASLIRNEASAYETMN